MAGIIAIYGLVVSFVLNGRIIDPCNNAYTLHQSFAHMAAGLTCGFCGLGAGYAIGGIADSFGND